MGYSTRHWTFNYQRFIKKGHKKLRMDEGRVLVNDISGYIKFFNACEVGDCKNVKFLVDHQLREWCKLKRCYESKVLLLFVLSV